MNKTLRSIGLWLLLGLIAISIASNFRSPKEELQEISVSEFLARWERGDISRVHIIGEHSVRGEFRDGREFQAYIPDITLVTDELKARQGAGASVEVTAEPSPPAPWWTSLLPQILSIVVFIGIWLFILNQVQGSGNRAIAFGKSRARLHMEERGKVTFNDVAGIDEAKEELAEIVEFLRHPKRFAELGAKIPKGVLLVGPPGTGKTLLGRAVAGEAGVPFFSISGSDFVEMFVGVGASRVRDLFDQAKKSSPCIVFIDEIDAVGRQRGAGLGGGHDEREQTLNALLVEMDGFEPNIGIIVLAATNRPDVLDPALLRPGRFDRQVVVDMPDLVGREAILKVHARNKPLAPDVDLRVLAKRTPGFTGADLENLLNEAALLAARRGKRKTTMDEAEEAIDRVIAGPQRKNRVISDKEKDLVAFHETGHALVAKLLPHADAVHKVSIIPRGRSGGYTLMFPEEDRHYLTKSEILDQITVHLAGRVAEELILGEISTGAQNDLERATKVVRKMVTEYGMSEELGPLTFGRSHEDTVFLGRDIARDRNYSEEVAAAIDKEARRVIDSCYDRARGLLESNKEKLVKIAGLLKERETLEGEELERVLSGLELPVGEPREAAPAQDAGLAKQGAAEGAGSGQKKPAATQIPSPGLAPC